MEIISETEESLTPPELLEKAKSATSNILPKTSRTLYEKKYNDFMAWCKKEKVNKYSENILLAYFSEQCKIYKPTSIWSIYSMLKSTLLTKNNVNISKYSKLIAFIKQNGVGYKPKKSKILSRADILKFLNEAPNETFLMIKVALIFGIYGACRRHELYNLQAQDIKEVDNVLVVSIPKTKTYQPRTFTIINDEESDVDYLEFYKTYSALRLNKTAGNQRFFLKYANGRCVNQVVGINTLGSLPSIIAKYLNLEDPQLFTGHCFRRTSATLLANAGADLIKIKQHGGWKSSTVAESYIDDSINNKIGTASRIMSSSTYGPPLPSSDPEQFISSRSSTSQNYLPSASSSTNCDDFTPSTSSEEHVIDQAQRSATVTHTEVQSINHSLTSALKTSGVNIQNCTNVTVNLTINNN